MARARTIKPGFFTNGDLIDCQPLARLLFAGLWTEADRRGVLEDRPKTLKIKLLGGDDCDADALLTELADHGFIRRYEADGRRCIVIINFEKHQSPHPKEAENELPVAEEQVVSNLQASDSPLSKNAIPYIPSVSNPSVHPVPAKRGKPSPDLEGFEEWYGEYPAHVGRADAEKAWVKLSADDRTAALSGLRAQLEAQAFSEDKSSVPRPATWLNGRRWQDEPVRHWTRNRSNGQRDLAQNDPRRYGPGSTEIFVG